MRIGDLSRTFGLFQDPLRIQLFLILVDLGKSGKTLCVSDLADRLGSSLSNTSHQLRKLEFAGVVQRLREGRMICYQLKKTPANMKIYNFIRSILNNNRL